MELALLSLYANATDELGPDQLGQLGEDLAAVIEDMPATEAVARAAEDVPYEGSIDQFALAQAFVLGVRVPSLREEDIGALRDLGNTLVSSVGVDTETGAQDDLIGAVATIEPGSPIPPDAIVGIASALGSALVVTEGAAPGQVEFSGPAARFAAMLVELAWNLPPRCRSRFDTVLVGDELKMVTLVEVDVCTDLPFAHIRERIDPRNWPTYNPYFISVTTIKGPDMAGDGWSGVVKEVVGPGVNGSVYETDLAVRCVAQPQLMAVAFDLAERPTGDKLVTVDRGFLSVTDEGARRRTRVLKVYRIEDLDLPHYWVCPLWAAQVALSGWWHS